MSCRRSDGEASSLALSAFSTPPDSDRSSRRGEGAEESPSTKEGSHRSGGLDDPSTTRSGLDAVSSGPSSSAATARLDLSEFLAPLEARIFSRIHAVEAMVEKRCGALERRLGAAGGVIGPRAAGAPLPGSAPRCEPLQAQVAALQTSLAHKEAMLTDLYRQLQGCGESDATLRNNLGEVWRQLKADRQDCQAKFQMLSADMESRMQGFIDKLHGQSAKSATHVRLLDDDEVAAALAREHERGHGDTESLCHGHDTLRKPVLRSAKSVPTLGPNASNSGIPLATAAVHAAQQLGQQAKSPPSSPWLHSRHMLSSSGGAPRPLRAHSPGAGGVGSCSPGRGSRDAPTITGGTAKGGVTGAALLSPVRGASAAAQADLKPASADNLRCSLKPVHRRVSVCWDPALRTAGPLRSCGALLGKP